MGNGLEPGDSIKATDTFKFFRGETAAVSPGDRDVPISKLVEYLNSSSVLTAFSAGGGGGNTLVSIDNTDSPYTVASGVTHVEVDATSGDVTVTLPAVADSSAREITFMRSDSASDNSITISGDANISGLSSKVMSVENRPSATYYNLNSSANNSIFIPVSGVSSSSIIIRAIWVQLPSDGTSDISFMSATPNASNWDITVHQLLTSTVHVASKWHRLQLTTPVTLPTTDFFGISVYGGDDTRFTYNATARTAGYSIMWFNTRYSTNQTNVVSNGTSTTGSPGLMAECEAAGTNDVFKLVGGSSTWYETIA